MVKEICKLLLLCASLLLCTDHTTRDGSKKPAEFREGGRPRDVGKVLSFTQLQGNIPTEDNKALDTSNNHLGSFGWQFFLKMAYIIIIIVREESLIWHLPYVTADKFCPKQESKAHSGVCWCKTKYHHPIQKEFNGYLTLHNLFASPVITMQYTGTSN